MARRVRIDEERSLEYVAGSPLSLVWDSCEKCSLSKFRRQVVMGRGDMPADILFIGEAPGKSEDLRGEPFIGRSGRILDMALEVARKLNGGGELPSYYITNCIACRPTNTAGGPNREPSGEEMWACWQRLEDEAQLVQPKVVVFLGAVAFANCKKAFPSGIHLYHPAYLLRGGGIKSPGWAGFCRALSEIMKGVQG